MSLKQLTVFVENKPGALVAITDTLAEHKVNIRALSIADTQEDEEQVRKARQKLLMFLYEQPENQKQSDFLFIIDDLTEYTSVNQFKSPEARKLYDSWKQRNTNLAKEAQKLEQQRDAYARADKAAKQKMSAALMELETRVIAEEAALEELIVKIRRTEKQFISK